MQNFITVVGDFELKLRYEIYFWTQNPCISQFWVK